ncbi:hypothetical protein BAUCODRAFT_54455, partial [Baudoinia panamericana UAMH 10762]
LVLGIESSCDDSSVALVEVSKHNHGELDLDLPTSDVIASHKRWQLRVIFHETVTANNDAFSGIHPLVALDSHRAHLAPLVQKAFRSWQEQQRLLFVAVTRGPGMRSNLAVGLDLAKGIALAQDVPLVGVHHMQAHALTPRLLVAQANRDGYDRKSMNLEATKPEFPYLSILVSGGHTMLMQSQSLTDHAILAETHDIALGDCLDKAARAILPANLLRPPYGAALERFAWHTDVKDLSDLLDHETYEDAPVPTRRQDELERRRSDWGWSLAPPLSESKGGEKSSRRMVYSFAGLQSSVERFMKFELGPHGELTRTARDPDKISLSERQAMAREVQRVAFEHLASRLLLYLTSPDGDVSINTVVVSGGVAANKFLRHVVRGILDARGFSHIKLMFPPIELCTDNALMIAWAGIEMYAAGYTTSLDVGPIRKWPLDTAVTGGGILETTGW